MANSIIEKDLIMEGNLSSDEGTIEINGKVTGDIKAHSIIVKLGGSTKGKLTAQSIAIEGQHTGSLQCDDLVLATTSEVRATVRAKTMAAESGVKINGKINVTGRQ